MQAHIQPTALRTAALAALLLASACGDGRESATPSPRDQAPRPADVQALNRSIEAHYPAQFRAEQRQGSVLLDIYVDEQGVVEGADVVPQTASDTTARMVLIDEQGRPVERTHQPIPDPAFGPAAKAALLDARFTPALRNGRRVSDTVRMTVAFAPSGGA